MHPLTHYLRSRLHRRLFLWFGLTIMLTAVLVGLTMSALNGDNWKTELERLENYVGGRFARVWNDPVARDELARSTAEELNLGVRLEDNTSGVVAAYGPTCSNKEVHVQIRENGVVRGAAIFCMERHRHGPWKVLVPLFIACCVVWMASGKIARRLAKPLAEVAHVAQEIGRGNLASRAQLSCRTPDEIGLLSDSINDMAARIEKQISDQRVLLAAVSHELRTPLGHLRILNEMAREQCGDQKTVDDIEKEIVEIDTLVGELLASSRLDFSILAKRELDAVDVAKRALDRAGLTETKLEVVAEAGPEKITADPTLLGRALSNLIDNAKKHGGGLVSLRVALGARDVRFEVDDEGTGISAADQAGVFEPFYQSNGGEKTSENGTLGLGLSLVRRIAEAHGGEAFAGARPGGGARVGFAIARV
jgi:signal transduction histidine kinase